MSMANKDIPQQPSARSDVVFRQLDDEWVLYDPIDNRMHVLNLTASLVWTSCTGSNTLAEISSEVAQAFTESIPHETALKDVEDVIARFKRDGLLQ